MFYDEDKELIYIGKSKSLGDRMQSSAIERMDAMYVTLMKTKTYADTGIYEMYYIAKLKPKLNVDGNTIDEPSVELPDLEVILEMYKFRE